MAQINYIDNKVLDKIKKKLRKPQICSDRLELVTKSFMETEGESIVIRRAKAFYKVLTEMPIWIANWQMIVGNFGTLEPFSAQYYPEYSTWLLDEVDTISNREGDKFIINSMAREKIEKYLLWWKGKTVEDFIWSLVENDVKRANEEGLISGSIIRNPIGQVIPNFEKVLQKGFIGIIEEIKRRSSSLDLTTGEDIKKRLFFQAGIMCCEAVIKFAYRFSELANKMAEVEENLERKKELLLISKICKRIPAYPAETFPEALQTIWFIELASFIEQGGLGISLGRFNKYLFPYYEQDIKSGKLSREEAKRWLASFWVNCNQEIPLLDQRTTLINAGYPLSMQPTIDGTDELSELCIEVDKEIRLSQPDIAVLIDTQNGKPSDEFLIKCAELLPIDMKPKFFNYQIGKRMIMERGVPEDVVEDWANVGCVAPYIPGKTWGLQSTGFFNFAKVLNETLGEAVDKKIKSFNGFMNLYHEKIKEFLRKSIILGNAEMIAHAERAPNIFTSLLVEDCILKGKTMHEGGCRYYAPAVNGVGLTVAVNSLIAIKKVIEEEVDLKKLRGILQKNFVNHEEFRQKLMYRIDKFGNDIPEVDGLACKIGEIFCDEVRKYKDPWGHQYTAGLYSVSAHIGLGMLTGATADGRLAGVALNDGISPAQGTCSEGPTAVIKSAAKINHIKACNGTLLNMKFSATYFRDPVSLRKFIALLKTYMELGGYHVQFNVIDTDILRDAQKHPEKYPDLLVRVAAYVAPFTKLPKLLQNDIIARSELNI